MRLFSSSHVLLALCCAALLLGGADGCSSDPDVEGAKLYVNQEDYPAALQNLDRALTTNPDNVEALALKARVLYLQASDVRDPAERRSLIEEMKTALDRTLALDPANEDAANVRLAAWADEMNAGSRFLQQSGGDETALASAVQAFENAVYVQPDSVAGYYNLGLAQLAGGQTEAAIPSLERAVQGGAASADAYRYLGRALLATDQGTRAVEVLTEGRTAFPDDDALRAELLNAYAVTGDRDRAVAEYEQMIQNDPDNPLLRYNYGSTLLQLERFDDAIEQLTEAAALDPQNANAFYNLGAAYQNKATKLNDELRETEDNERASQLRAERDALLEEALPHLEQARDLTEAQGEDPADICQALFQVYARLEREDDAREAGECAGMDMN